MGEQIIESDVAVVGGGNAALCAALTARESGASVTVLECAPVEFRGGNSRHTRNMRCMHDAPTGVLTDAYTEDEYFDYAPAPVATPSPIKNAQRCRAGVSQFYEWLFHGPQFHAVRALHEVGDDGLSADLMTRNGEH